MNDHLQVVAFCACQFSAAATAKYAEPRKANIATPAPSNAGAANKEANNQMSRLNDMMDNMNSDMSRQGLQNVPKATCEACQMGIVGQVRSTKY